MDIYKAYKNGLRNTKTRWLFIIATLVYILSPIDLIPDFIPILGQIDDLTILVIFGMEIAKIIGQQRRNAKKIIDVDPN